MHRPSPRGTYRYTDHFKATAVRLSELPGISVADVAQSLYIHPFMLSRWRKLAREGIIVTKGVGSTGGSRASELPIPDGNPPSLEKPMKSPCYAIIGAACFLEQSSEALVDPDAAIAALEEMAVALRAATLPEMAAFIATCQSEAIRLRVAGDVHSSTFVADLPSTMGLSVVP